MPSSSTRPAKRRAPPPRRDNTPIIYGGVALAIIIVGVLVWINLNAPAQQPINVSSGKIWGDPNAPVTIEEWSDFQ